MAIIAALRAAIALICLSAALASQLRKKNNETNAAYRLKLSNYKNVQYSAPFSLGSQTLPVIYDTGSFEILVLSTLCKACSRSQLKYDSSKSTSFAAAGGITAEHLFGSGAVTSEKGFETVKLGGVDSPFAMTHMPFWQVVHHQIDVWNDKARFSGIVGMGHVDRIPEGFGADSSADYTLLASLQVKSFALCLERTGPDSPGWLSIGQQVDAMPQLTNNFAALDVVGHVHWGVRMTQVNLPNVELPNLCWPSCGVIVDSGTSLIAVPPSALPMVHAIEKLIKEDCSNVHDLPVLQMTLDTTVISLPPSAYVMKVQSRVYQNSSLWDHLYEGPRYVYQDKCYAAFMTIDKNSQFGPVWILGMPFLRYYYTIFDRQSKKIFIAESQPNCELKPRVPQFVNTTRFRSKGSSGVSSYTAADYKPVSVDLNAARIPDWVLDRSSRQINM